MLFHFMRDLTEEASQLLEMLKRIIDFLDVTFDILFFLLINQIVNIVMISHQILEFITKHDRICPQISILFKN